MSFPILYSAEEKNFDHNGIGVLSGCRSCLITEEANGAFELEMKYPVDGIHCSSITERSIIKSRPNQDSRPQLFRVYSVVKNISGVVSVRAAHISYDLSGIPVPAFSAANVREAMDKLRENAVVECPFTFITDKNTVANFLASVPGSIRSKLGGSEGSILDVYGGEYEFDNFTVILHNKRGQNRGVSIRYRKNLTDIKQDMNCASIYTGVYPYWVDPETGESIELPEKIVSAKGEYNFVKINVLDVSDKFEARPTVEQIRSYTNSYIEANNIGVPTVSLSVSFAQLEQSEEYKGTAILERVALFDTVMVEFPALGVSATAKAVKIVYNSLIDRVESVSLGSVRSKITDTVATQNQQLLNVPTSGYVQSVSYAAAAAATAWLTNGKGYKVERLSPDGSTIDTLYLDTPSIDNAVNVLRIGQSGIGFSQNGVNGPFSSAWTIDGSLNASFIKAGSFSAEAEIFIEPGLEEHDAIKDHILHISEIPSDRIHLYDFDGDGEITISDMTMCRAAMLGIQSLSSWPGAVLSKISVSLDPKEPGRSIKISGTNMWGRLVEQYFGIGGASYDVHHGNLVLTDKLSIGGSMTFERNTLAIGTQLPKELSWKDNGDGTFNLIGQ